MKIQFETNILVNYIINVVDLEYINGNIYRTTNETITTIFN